MAAAADHSVPESIVRDAGVGGEAHDGVALRSRDLRREDGGRVTAALPEALHGGRSGRILDVLGEEVGSSLLVLFITMTNISSSFDVKRLS